MNGADRLLGNSDERPGTADVRRLRIAREAALIAEADAELAADRGRTDGDLEAWLDAWERGGPLPPPGQPR